MIHVVEIREILNSKPGTVKFKSTANLTYNCNKDEFNGMWAVGEKYKIDFNTSSFQGSNGPVEMKWVNRARPWMPEDGEVDPAEKPVYNGGGGGRGNSNRGGGMSKGKDYDPEVSKRQTAANCAMAFCGQAQMTIDDLKTFFPQVAEIVLEYLNKGSAAAGSDAGVAGSEGGDGAGSYTDDIPF